MTHVRFTRHTYLVTYLLAMNLLAFINIFLAGQKLSSLWLMPVAIGSALITVNYLQRLTAAERPVVSFVDLCVLAYFFYSILSVGLYVQPSNPASPRAYLYGVNLQIMPMLMYFSVKGLDSEDMDRILKFIVVLHVAFALIGIFLFFSRPNFYAEYLIDTLGFTDTWQIYARLQSYWGSTATGILSAVTIVLLPNINVSRLVRNLLLVLFLVTIFLAQQRGAYMSGVLATAYFLYREKISLLRLLVAVGFFAIVLVYLLNRFDLTVDLFVAIINNRIIDGLILGDPFAERAVSYEKGLALLSEFPAGLGLGATTSAADDAGAHVGGQVVDAYFMRIAADLGVLGLFLLLTLLAVAFFASLRGARIRGISVVIMIYVLESAGTNVLDTYYVSHVFWALLGLAIDGSVVGRVGAALPVAAKGVR